MKFRNYLLTATMIAAPVALSHTALAQPVTGLYVGAGGGYNSEIKFKAKDGVIDGVNVPNTAKISTLGGYLGEASVGYGFGDGLRVELQGDYYNNRFKNIGGDGFGGKAAGYEEKYGAMVNAIYDLDIGLPFLYPYIGGGLGWQIANFKDLGGDFGGGSASINKERGSFAFQGIAGLSFPIAPVMGLSATVEYRFLGMTGARKYSGDYAGLPVTFKVQHEYNNAVVVGLRYAFDVPPPPAPPAPAPTPVAAPAPVAAKSYLVFFDWDKSDLTPKAIDIIAQAASDSHTQQTTTIDVSGYTDTSGTPAYNLGLSKRRANAVAAQLVTDGVSQSEIAIHAYGETHLLVPTGTGVREPQNRRVEIVLQ